MTRQLTELEEVLRSLIGEHRKLLAQVDAQQQAMRQLKPAQIEQITSLQETTRLRIATLDTRRRMITIQLGKIMRTKALPTLSQVIAAFPQQSKDLSTLRDELRQLVQEIRGKTSMASRLAGAVLGHLNTAVRLIAGAVEQAGVYTKNGTPRVAARIGAIEAVG